ncbi:MAG: hypothetical protein AAGJ82_10055 [Bacteroidota bacterium]
MQHILLFVVLLLTSLRLSAQTTLQVYGSYLLNIRNAYLVTDSTHLYFRTAMNNSFAILKITGDYDTQLEAHGNQFSEVEIAKTPGKKVVMSRSQDHLFIEDRLNFSSIDNHLLVNTAAIRFYQSGEITGYSDRNYCITNDLGYLQRQLLGATPFEFPIGYDENTYNPVILAEYNTPADYRVRCLEHVLTMGDSGTPISNGAVDASYHIWGGNSGDMLLEVVANWADVDELSGFDRSKCGVSRWNGTQWDLQLPDVGPAVGSNPYLRDRADFMDEGYFAVGGQTLADPGGRVDVKVLLQGTYDSAGEHRDDLRSGGYLPGGEPYSALGFQQAGFGGGEAVDLSVYNTTGSDAIVDWLLLEIFDTNTPEQLVATKTVLLQKDGDVVDLDGESVVNIPGLPEGNYRIALLHRNHLPVKIAVPVFLSATTTTIDLMTDPMTLVGGPNAVTDFGDGFYGLVSGDSDGNGQIQNTDGNNMLQILGASGYLSGDTDLNGQVQNIDLQLKLTPNLGRGQQY